MIEIKPLLMGNRQMQVLYSAVVAALSQFLNHLFNLLFFIVDRLFLLHFEFLTFCAMFQILPHVHSLT